MRIKTSPPKGMNSLRNLRLVADFERKSSGQIRRWICVVEKKLVEERSSSESQFDKLYTLLTENESITHPAGSVTGGGLPSNTLPRGPCLRQTQTQIHHPRGGEHSKSRISPDSYPVPASEI